MRRLNLLIALVIIAVSGIAAPGLALAVPQPEAEEAYARGDYKTAFALWLPLAEQGSPRAQMNIARMYERGEWVAQDSAMAAEWYRKAAEQSIRDSENAPASAPATQALAGAPPAVIGGTPTPPPAPAPYVQPTYVQPTYTRPTYAQPVYYPVVVRRVAPGAAFHHHWRR